MMCGRTKEPGLHAATPKACCHQLDRRTGRGGVVGLRAFAVHLLWVDDEVDEAAPVFDSGARASEAPSADDPESAPTDAATPPEPQVVEVAQGEFVSLDHGTSGRAVS